MNVYEKLSKLQSKVNVGKGNRNAFGKYNYRTIDDIFDGIKPYLDEFKVAIYVTNSFITLGEDEISKVSKDTKNEYRGAGLLIKSTARFVNCEKPDEFIETEAFAKLDFMHAGMSFEQMTGCAITYANKYALTSLLLLSANDKDIDSEDNTNIHPENNKDNNKLNYQKSNKAATQKAAQQQPAPQPAPKVSEKTLAELVGLIDTTSANKDKILSHFKKDILDELTELEAQTAINIIHREMQKAQQEMQQAQQPAQQPAQEAVANG